MRICITTTKLTHREHRRLAFVKVLLYDSDSGVRDEMDRFERLAKDELSTTVALILESAKTNERAVIHLGGQVENVTSSVQNLQTVLERTEKEKKGKEAAEVNRAKIRDALGINDKEEPWAATYDKIVVTLIPQSGSWLLKDDSFSAWAKADHDANYIIVIEGKDGFGKTSLCTAIIRHMLIFHTTQVSERRVAIAYFFFQSDAQENKDTKETHGEKQRDPLDVAVKSIIWQLIKKDPAFRKFVAAACKNREEPVDIEEVWTRLVTSHSHIDATFFILLDGIENLDDKRKQRLFRIIRRSMDMNTRSQHLQIQWFVTGRPSSFSSSPQMALEESSMVSKFTLGTCNQDDILNLIDARMNDMPALINKSNDDTKNLLRLKIRERLSEGVCGDFTKLSYKLRDIDTKSRVDEIEEVLTQIDEGIHKTIARQLQVLNDELDERDLIDLNELLVWVVAIESSTPWAVTVSLLEEVLSLTDTPPSLIPLQDRIKTTFAPVLEIDDDQVELTASLLDYFAACDSDENKIVSESENNLHPKEIAIVKRILQNFCDEDLYQRFQFETYFERKSGKSKTIISVNISKVHVTVVKTLLAVLCGDQATKCPKLVQYAVEHLADHLRAERWASASQKEKRNTGPLLLKIFREEKAINQTWMRDESLWAVRYYWIISNDDVANTLAWFKDPATTLDFPDHQRAWITSLISNATQQADLLKDVVLALAKSWLHDPKFWASEKFEAVAAFYSKVSSTIIQGTRNTYSIFQMKCRETGLPEEDCTTLFKPDVATINAVEAWIESELPNETKDATWELNMSGIFVTYEFGTQALHRGRAASKLEPMNWRANFAIASAYALDGPDQDIKTAIEEMSVVAATFRSRPDLLTDTATLMAKVFSDQVLKPLGTWKTELKQYQSAMEVYEELLTRFPKRTETVLDILNLLKVQGRISEIYNFLFSLNTQIDVDGASRLIRLFHSLSYDQYVEFYDFISATLKEPHCLALVRETLKSAIDHEVARSAEETTIALMELRFWYAYLLYHIVECDSDHDNALVIWEENLAFRAVEPAIHAYRFITAKHIAEAYLHRAKNIGIENPRARDLLARLEALPKYLGKDDLYLLPINRLLGRGYSLMGQEAAARNTLRRDVQEALELLSDDDISNDWQGYEALALALTPLSDDVNALAAWSLLCPITDSKVEESDSNSSLSSDEEEAIAGADDVEDDNCATTPIATEDASNIVNTVSADSSKATHKISSHNKGDGPMGYSCDGLCGRSWSFPDDMYFCKDCRDVQLDTPCYEKLKEGTLKFGRAHCYTSHDFLHVPSWDVEAIQKVPQGSVKVGEQILTIKEWLNGIKKDWGFDNMIS